MTELKARREDDRRHHGAAVFAARLRMVALALLLLPAFALAQAGAAPKGNPRLASLSIEIWPEYDRPAALVILRGVLAESVKLPAVITLRLPAASDGPGAVAYSTTADGNLLNLKHERAKSGEFITLKFVLPERFFHVEFYEPIATGNAARAYRYVWPGDLAVERATVVVQEPASSSDFSVEPRLERLTTGQDGLRYRTADLGALEAGKPLSIALRYTKLDASPSKPKAPEPPEPPAPVAAPPAPAMVAAPVAAATSGGLPNWVFPLAAMALLALLGAALILWWWRRESGVAKPFTHFCATCGAAQARGSRFCATCGAKVRLGDDADHT